MADTPIHALLRKDDLYAVDTFSKLPTVLRDITDDINDSCHPYRNSRNMSRLTGGVVLDIPMSAPGYSFRRPVKTALHQAILDCRVHQVRLLVEKHGGDVDAQDMFGRTPLMLACLLENETYGHRMAALFIRSGCYINMRDNMNRTALHYACLKGRVKMVLTLLKEDNIDIGMPDNDGNNSLMHAALSGSPKIVEIIVDKVVKFGLPVDERNAMGYTAFLLACKHGHYVSAYFLLFKGGSQPDIRDTECNMTAKEWVKKSAKDAPLQEAFSARKSKTMPEMPLGPLAFTREHTMYPDQEGITPECRHIGTAPGSSRRVKSLGSALRLPELFKVMGAEDAQVETVIAGRDARNILLQAIDESIKNRKKFRKPNNKMLSLSRLPTTQTQTRGASTTSRATLSSSKLREIISRESRKSKLSGSVGTTPDLMMLFKLYSDKYVGVGPDSAPGTRGTTAGHSDNFPLHVRFDTAPRSSRMESPLKTGESRMGTSPPVIVTTGAESVAVA